MTGGWHDAGDYNKYVNFAYSAVLDLLMSYEFNPEAWTFEYSNIPESGNGIPDLLDEIKYELDWLKKMQDTDWCGSFINRCSKFCTASLHHLTVLTDFTDQNQQALHLCICNDGICCHSIQKNKVNPTAQAYATILQTNAEAAFNWGISNPSQVYYNAENSGRRAGSRLL